MRARKITGNTPGWTFPCDDCLVARPWLSWKRHVWQPATWWVDGKLDRNGAKWASCDECVQVYQGLEALAQ